MLSEQELEALYESMSEEDRLGQLLQLSDSYFGMDGMVTGVSPGDAFSEEHMRYVGTLIMGSASPVEKLRAIQEQHMQHSRVPLMLMADVISGYPVSLPFPLAQAGSFDPEWVKMLARKTADASTAYGLNVTFSPMVDISRDARWGRCLESYGEDVTLACRMARAMVEGYQGDDPSAPDSLSACVKHFAAYGYPEGGRDYNNVILSERALMEIFLPPYKAAVDAGCDMLMSSFNSISGIPTNVDTRLMRDLLRDKWGFDGVNITDWGSLGRCGRMGASNDEEELARGGMECGIDISMMDPIYARTLPRMLKEGTIDPALVKESVMRVLRLKNKKGLLEDPYRYLTGRPVDGEEHYRLAVEAVEKTCVLLKNEQQTLPLSTDRQIALIGPYAVRERAVSMWNTRSRVGEQYRRVPKAAFDELMQQPVLCEPGCSLLEKGHFMLKDETDPCLDNPRLYVERAVRAAAQADTVVMMIGEHWLQSGESASRTDITVPEIQMELLRRVHEVNDNIVTVVFTGRPLDLREVDRLSRAILLAWMPGDGGSDGIARLLTGHATPTAKLAMSFPYCVGQCPIHYDYSPTGHNIRDVQDKRFTSRYVDAPNTPKYPFGYGLSYTTFAYTELTASSEEMTAQRPLTLTVTVTNTGDADGEEIVQLYIHDLHAFRVARPLRQLKDFKRVALKKGESRQVSFTVEEPMLRYYTYDGEFASEPGEFTAFVGGSSDADLQVNFHLK